MNSEKLIRELSACAVACNVCFRACLGEEHVLQLTRCIELDRECADICQQTASILSRDSSNADHFLGLCANICKQCAEECEKHPHEHCAECAAACRFCYDRCMEYRSELTEIH